MESVRQNLQKRHLQGGETPDPTPVHIPGKQTAPLSLREEMRRYVRTELSRAAQESDAGSFEDEDDFAEDTMEPDLLSPYSVVELSPDTAPHDDLEGNPQADATPETPPAPEGEQLEVKLDDPEQDVPPPPVTST